jgi:hypothetical protein
VPQLFGLLRQPRLRFQLRIPGGQVRRMASCWVSGLGNPRAKRCQLRSRRDNRRAQAQVTMISSWRA